MSQQTVYWEVSPDGAMWNEFHTYETSADFSEATLKMGSANYGPIDAVEIVSLESVLATCEAGP